jgi:hypothetical protein
MELAIISMRNATGTVGCDEFFGLFVSVAVF